MFTNRAKALHSKPVMIALQVALLVLVAWHMYQLFYVPRQDFDTMHSMFLGTGADAQAGLWGDPAHPLLICLIQKLLLATAHGHVHFYWSLIMAVFFIAGCVVIYALPVWVGASRVRRMGLLVLFMMSPSILDMTARAEENVTQYAMFFAALLAMQKLWSRRERQWVYCLACGLNCLVGLNHLQPFTILLATGFSGAAIALFSRQEAMDGNHARRGKFSVRFLFWTTLLPLAVVLAVCRLITFHAVPYQTIYYNVFNQPGDFGEYVRKWLLCADGFLLGGGALITDAIESAPWHVWTGLAVMALLIVLAARRVRRFPLVALPVLFALAFAFVYEPVSSERWDAVVVTLLALCAVAGLRGLAAAYLVVVAGYLPLNLRIEGENIRTLDHDRWEMILFLRGRYEIYLPEHGDIYVLNETIFRAPAACRIRLWPEQPPRGMYFISTQARLNRPGDPPMRMIQYDRYSNLMLVRVEAEAAK